MTGDARRHETRHYPTNDPATPQRTAQDVGVVLESWRLATPVVTALVARAHTLVAEAIAAYGGERVTVTVVRNEDRATVHVLSVVCLQEHPDGLIDPATANVLLEAAERWGPPLSSVVCARRSRCWATTGRAGGCSLPPGPAPRPAGPRVPRRGSAVCPARPPPFSAPGGALPARLAGVRDTAPQGESLGCSSSFPSPPDGASSGMNPLGFVRRPGPVGL